MNSGDIENNSEWYIQALSCHQTVCHSILWGLQMPLGMFLEVAVRRKEIAL